MSEPIVYKHKDGNRDWWELTIKDSGFREKHDQIHNENDEGDYVWACELKLLDKTANFNFNYKFLFTGQHDDPPRIDDIMHEIQVKMSDLTIGFVSTVLLQEKYKEIAKLTNQ